MIPTYDNTPQGVHILHEQVSLEQARRRKRLVTGIISITVAVVFLFIASMLPSGFVIRQPGPVVNTLGEVPDGQGGQISLISIPEGTESFPTDGTLSLTTIQIVGNRESTPNWLQLAQAWFDPSKAVMNLDDVFPQDQSSEERQEADALMMTNSQQAATAAALVQMGYTIPTQLEVVEVTADGAAADKLSVGDVVNGVDGVAVTDVLQLREKIGAKDGAEVIVNITRDGKKVDVPITPTEGTADGEVMWLLGVAAGAVYDLPIDITIQLNNIGGPSAGMMFALGIIDTLTPGAMNGGASIAGTGTIDPAGAVGPIGGIQQKLFGAQEAGADFFLAPAANCSEVIGHIPEGLQVIKVETLTQARNAVETIGKDDAAAIAKLARCSIK